MINNHPTMHQEDVLKLMIEQKEVVVSKQKEALKREREMSLKLRQAIYKMNLKNKQQQA